MSRWHNHYPDYHAFSVQDWSPKLDSEAIAIIYEQLEKAKLMISPEIWPHSSYRQLALDDLSLTFICDGWEVVPL